MTRQERLANRTDRLVGILLLLHSRRNLTSRDLAEYFGVSRRTIFRDLRTLSELGLPLACGEHGGYEILEGYYLPPLMFSARQAATLLVSTEFMKLQADMSLRKEAEEVADKIRSVLPSHLRVYMDQLRKHTILDPYWVHEAPPEEVGKWHDLNDAIARGHRIRMEYYVQSRRELTMRMVNPLGLVYYTDRWNLVAYDHTRKGIRNFILENIRSLHVLKERFDAPKGFNLKEYVRRQDSRREGAQIVIRFSARVYRRARRSIPAEIESEIQDGDFMDVTFYFDNLAYLANYLLRFGHHVQALAPEALRKRIYRAASDIVFLHGDGEANA